MSLLLGAQTWESWGLAGLALASFLAGGPLPFPSELTLVALLQAGAQPLLCVLVATLGNVLGALTVFAIGAGIARGGRLGERLAARHPEDPDRLARARQSLERWGSPLLALAWVPVVGDVLVLAAGLARVRLLPALLWISLGKAARYAFVAGTCLQLLG